MMLASLVAVTAAAGTRRVEFRTCGVTFTMPASWSAQLMPAKQIDDSMQCGIALRPRGWAKRARHSRWGAPAVPLSLFVFKTDTTYVEALDQMQFETNEESGRGFGIPGGYDSFAEARPYKAGKLTGLAAYTDYRGFISNDALLHKDESRVFGAETGHVVLRTPSGRSVGFLCETSTPDEPVKCEPVIQMIGRSIAIKTRR